MTIAVGLAAMVPAIGHAQAPQCRADGPIVRPHPDLASAEQPRRLLPIGGYTLAVSWSPEYCHARTDARDAFQCGSANRFGFTLHGLWPDGPGKDWPQYCRPQATPLPERTIRAALCATPSPQLVQHEWSKHGTCMAGLTPDRYFERSTALYRGLRFPDMDALSRRPGLTAGGVAAAIAAANPGMTADGIRLNVNKRGWLEEAWLCLDTRFRPRRCPIAQGGAAPATPVKVQRAG